MKVSFNQTISPNVRDTNGFGYAAKMCKESLVRLGHEVDWRDETADVEINFIQPENWHWTGPYRIAYLPWESTGFRPGWIDKLNECDEVWTPSPVIGQWMVDAGLKKEPYIYEHGVESLWTPVKRDTTERFKLLHHGAEALRKGGNSAIWSYMDVLSKRDAELHLKMLNEGWAVQDTDHIKIHKTKVPIEELVELYHQCHLFVYPSWGEGFGLTPLQAMATGMPVLVTDGWAPYARFLGTNNIIKSALDESPWPDHHPGKMFRPDEDDLRDKLTYHYENRDYESKVAFDLVEEIVKAYDWDDLTAAAINHLYSQKIS